LQGKNSFIQKKTINDLPTRMIGFRNRVMQI